MSSFDVVLFKRAEGKLLGGKQQRIQKFFEGGLNFFCMDRKIEGSFGNFFLKNSCKFKQFSQKGGDPKTQGRSQGVVLRCLEIKIPYKLLIFFIFKRPW